MQNPLAIHTLPGEESPHTLISMWDMKEFAAESIVRVTTILKRFVDVTQDVAHCPKWPKWPTDEQKRLKTELESIVPHLEALGLPKMIEPCRRSISAVALPGPKESVARAKFLQELFDDELRSRNFLFIPADKLKFYTSPNPFDLEGEKDISDKFPKCNGEGVSAAKCIALAQPTACVFHLMRVLEIALGIFSTKGLKLPDPTSDWERSWGKVLGPIKDTIDYNNRPKTAPAGWKPLPNWKANKPFYENGYAFFEAVRSPWRNSTMHVARDYNETQAMDIFNPTGTLMRHLATRLKE